ncbi:hypothetical protein LCGC14_0665910 [marine sediment metagenome]|uniref:Beta-lactamase-inhibitor-like, PepSY-like n=2 Tax=root TaxID=1 RepID=A0A831QNA1_9FLAO|nr:hypothetical protein [Pricia antarctica]
MKKIAFIAVFSLGGLSAFAQVADPGQQTTNPTQQTTDPTTTQPQTADPSQQGIDPAQQETTYPTNGQLANPPQQTGAQETPVRDADGYAEIKRREIPGTLKKAMKENYPKSKIKTASSTEDGHYKLQVDLEDGTSETMLVDENGNPME